MKVTLSSEHSQFLAHLRALSILVIILGHCGLFWLHRPHTEVLQVFVAVFFFMSGALSFVSYQNAPAPGDYYRKRLTAVLVPYYLAMVLVIVVGYLIRPDFAMDSLEKWALWLTLVPKGSKQLFGQIWFLHTLLIILLLSPLYFRLTQSLKATLVFLLPLALLGLWPIYDESPGHRYLLGHSYYQPLMHSLFFIMGILFIRYRGFTPRINLALALAGIALSIGLAVGLDLNPDYGMHTAPDLYYMAGCVGAIFLFILWMRPLLQLGNLPVIRPILHFFNKYTFALFLLHSIPIDVLDQLDLLDHLRSYGPAYPLAKMASVLTFSALLAVPFTRLADQIAIQVKKIGHLA